MQKPILILSKQLFEVEGVEIVDDFDGDAVYLRGLERLSQILPIVCDQPIA